MNQDESIDMSGPSRWGTWRNSLNMLQIQIRYTRHSLCIFLNADLGTRGNSQYIFPNTDLGNDWIAYTCSPTLPGQGWGDARLSVGKNHFKRKFCQTGGNVSTYQFRCTLAEYTHSLPAISNSQYNPHRACVQALISNPVFSSAVALCVSFSLKRTTFPPQYHGLYLAET